VQFATERLCRNAILVSLRCLDKIYTCTPPQLERIARPLASLLKQLPFAESERLGKGHAQKNTLYMKYLFFVMLSLSWWGCQTNTAGKEDEVMAIHDEAMAKMGQLEALGTQLSDMKAQLPVTEENADKIVGINNEIMALREAGDGMMDWMRAYRDNAPKRQAKDNAAYWAEELIQVQAVRDSINNVIDRAQSLTKNLNL